MMIRRVILSVSLIIIFIQIISIGTISIIPSIEMNLTKSTDYEEGVLVTQGYNGTLYLLYKKEVNRENRLILHTVNYKGVSVFEPIDILPSNVSLSAYGSILVNKNRVHIVFSGLPPMATNTNVFYTQIDLENRIVIPAIQLTQSNNSTTNPHITCDILGNIILFWTEISTQPILNIAHFDIANKSLGKAFQSLPKMKNGTRVQNPQLVFSRNNEYILFWEEKGNASSYWAIRYSILTSSFLYKTYPKYLFLGDNINCQEITCVIDKNDIISIIYLAATSSTYTVNYLKMDLLGNIVSNSSSWEGVGKIRGISVGKMKYDTLIIGFLEQDITDSSRWSITLLFVETDLLQWNRYNVTESYYMLYPAKMCILDDGRLYLFYEKSHDIYMISFEDNVFNKPPVARLTYQPLDPGPGDIIYFNGSGSYNPNDINSTLLYKFDWGDENATGWLDSPISAHRYQKSGIYTVELHVKDRNGLVNDKPSFVTVNVENRNHYVNTINYIFIILLFSVVTCMIFIIIKKREQEI